MKAAIEVNDRREASAVKAAMEDPEAKALAIIMGALAPLPDKARLRVMQYILDKMKDAPAAA